ncbi:MAG: hypothetical protein AB8F34_01295 [Akkermansiaceae bacterium]
MKNKTIPIAIILLAFLGLVLFLLNKSPEEPTNPSNTDRPQIEFLTAETIEIERDYNQDRLIAIKNHGPGMAKLRLSAQPQKEDLLAGFVGRGTTEWHESNTIVGIPEGETWQLPLLLHADRSSGEFYDVDLTATLPDNSATKHAVKIKVTQAKLKLNTRWEGAISELNQARLARYLIIKNECNTQVSDLAVHFEMNGEQADEKLRWSRHIEAFPLAINQTLKLKIAPRIYPTFQSLKGQIVISGINQKHTVPYEIKVPEDKQVFVTLSRTTRSSSGSGKRCTNRPTTTYPVPPTDGTGGNWAPSSHGSGSGGGISGGDTVAKAPESPGLNEDTSDGTEDEEDEEFGWIPEGYGADKETKEDKKDKLASPDDKETKEEKKKREDKDIEVDEVSFDHSDSNLEDVRGGFISPKSNGTSLNDNIFNNSEKPFELMEAPRIDPETIDLPNHDKEVSSHVDKNGKKTHMTKRSRRDGTTFLNFGFGIQKGVRKKVPMRIPGMIGQPTMGPRPGKDGGSIAAYTRNDKEKGQIVEVIDPITGKKITVGDGKADSPQIVENGDMSDLYYRENGALKRVILDKDLNPSTGEIPPNNSNTIGPLTKVAMSPDALPIIISKEKDGIGISTSGNKKIHKATNADIEFLKNGKALTVLRQPDGAISAIDTNGNPQPIISAHADNSPPTLIKTDDGGLRMFFSRTLPEDSEIPTTGIDAGGHFSVDYKNGQWGEPRRQLMPKAEVEEAAVVTSFNLPYGHAHYKPMNTKVFLNDKQVGEMRKKIPAGRYVFPADPAALTFAAPSSKKKNKIQIQSKGIGPGNYHTSDHVGLYTRHKLCQDCLVAVSSEKAEELANQSDQSVRHRTADIIVASNGYELPRQASPGQEIDVKLSLFNAGDRSCKPGKLEAIINNRIVGEADFKGISPFRGRIARMKVILPVDWKKGTSLKMTIKVPQTNDADPSNNSLDFYILKAPDQRIANRDKPLRIDPSQLNPELITAVTAGDKSTPKKIDLKSGNHWYKIEPKSSSSGSLQVEVVGDAADDLHRMYLFDADGNQVKNKPVKGPFYLQVHAPKLGNTNTKINFWWE